MIRKILLVALPLVVLTAGAWAAWALIQSYEPPQKVTPEPEPPLVRTAPAEVDTLRLRVLTEGTVAPRAESELSPEVAGRVVEVSPALAGGAFFAKGDVLLRIDPREYELAVTRAKAAIAQAQVQLAQEEQEAAVARREWESLGSSGEPNPLVLREPQLAEARAQLASAEAQLEQAQYDLERTTLNAPYDGRVRQKRVDVGQFVQRGVAIATIYSVDVAEVRLPIPDDQLAFVDLPLAYRGTGDTDDGPSVILRADFGGETYEWRGRIVRTEGEIDPQTRVIHAVAQVQNPYARKRGSRRPPLAVGMFVQAEILGKTVKSVVVPRSALRGDDQLLVVNPEGRVEFRDLDILRRERDRVLVRGGVTPGEQVLVSPLEAAVEGMQVRAVTAGEAKPAAD